MRFLVIRIRESGSSIQSQIRDSRDQAGIGRKSDREHEVSCARIAFENGRFVGSTLSEFKNSTDAVSPAKREVAAKAAQVTANNRIFLIGPSCIEDMLLASSLCLVHKCECDSRHVERSKDALVVLGQP